MPVLLYNDKVTVKRVIECILCMYYTQHAYRNAVLNHKRVVDCILCMYCTQHAYRNAALNHLISVCGWS